MDTVFIYALKDPVSGHIRYIGKSSNPEDRLRQHLYESSRGENYRSYWIKSLISKGQKPLLEIIDETSLLEWPAIECAYIQFFREQGCALVNSTDGGENPPSFLGKRCSSEHRAKIGDANRGRIFTAGVRLKMSAGQKGKSYSAEARANMGKSRLGNTNSLGYKHSADLCKKRSDIARLYWEKKRASVKT